MSRHLVVLACVAMVVSAAAERAQHGAAQLEATAFVTSEDKCEIVAGIHSNGSAYGTFSNTIASDGWSSLNIHTSGGASNSTIIQAFAVGCLEAYFTHDLIYDYWHDYAVNNYPGGVPGKDLRNFITTQMDWLRSQISAKAGSGEPYWVGMEHLMAQFDGLVTAYQQFTSPAMNLTTLELYMLESMGDLEDLNGVFPSMAEAINHDTGIPNAEKDTDCSGFIKILPDNSDIVVGHSTWRDFFQMLRVYKVYHLDYAPVGTVSMSSSPGFLHSKDDFYATPTTIVLETTNSIFNKELYKKLTPECAFSWQRAAVATEWATTGQEWTEMFATFNSGTYNNQWMVVDASLFTPGEAPPTSNLLWILEQIPGTTQAADVTSVLVKDSYWGSYNIPYFPSIYNVSGYPAMAAKYGSPYVYSDCQRANIFRRNQTAIASEMDVRMLMRYNNYAEDPLSLGDPVLGSVCARGDLQKSDPVAFGCVDSKVTTATQTSATVHAVSGPTHVQQPVFVFDPKFENVVHTGVENVWDFDWTTFEAQA